LRNTAAIKTPAASTDSPRACLKKVCSSKELPVSENVSPDALLEDIAEGRTDRVFDYLAAGHPATEADRNGVTLMQWCAYYGGGGMQANLLGKPR
jgi:hypothetical protein